MISAVSVYTLGLMMDYANSMGNDAQRQNDYNAVVKLAENSQYGKYGADATTADYTQNVGLAQTLLAYVDYLELGKTPPDAKYASLVNQALKHIDDFFVQQYWMTDGIPFAPWQIGMTLQALIRANSYQADSRIPGQVKLALDWLWTNAWRTSVSGSGFFADSMMNSSLADPSQNLMLAPAYAWYYKLGQDTNYRDRADQVFSNGVQYAPLDVPSEFNKNYMWSFDYVALRQPPASSGGGSSGSGSGSGSSGGSGGGSGGGAPANSAPVCDKVWVRPSVLWPPNNKMVSVEVGGITDPDGDSISLTYGAVTQNEPVKGLEAADVGPDAEFPAQSGKWYLRAQRSGSGSGREYVIPFTADDGHGLSCAGSVTVTVPHDKGQPVPHSSQRFNSTQR
jgi:uncharacterized membrane protein YgcG